MTLSKAARKKLISSSRVRQINQLVEIARPFAQDMKHLKPSLNREPNQYVPFKVPFTLTVIVFIVSTGLQLVFMYVHHRYNLRDRTFPRSSTKKLTIRPVLQTPKDCPPNLSQTFSKRYHLVSHNANESSETPYKAPL